jgi:hypothetical protein
MKARFDAGTDVAMIGAWDARRGAQPFSANEFKRLSEVLDAESAAGHIFVVHTGGDGAGPVDVYIDEPVPSGLAARLTPIGGEFVLALPSGTLVVDGAELYRSPKATVTTPAVTVPAGDYTLRCYEATEKEGAPPSERGLEAIVGPDELRYYDRVTRGGCAIGALLLLLLPALWPLLGVKVAFAVTVAVVVVYFNVREWMLRRNQRFLRLRDTITTLRLEQAEPTFVLELRRSSGHTLPDERQ